MLCFFVGTFWVLQGQELTPSYLEGLEDEELLSLFDKVHPDTLKMEKVARTYLDRGKKEGDTIKMARGYDRLARIFSPEKNIAFADSIILLTKNQSNITYPSLGYLMKGVYYGRMDNVRKQYENYIKTYALAKEQKNYTHIIFVLGQMSILQAEWGSKVRALLLQKELDSIINTSEYYDNSLNATRSGARIKAFKHYQLEKIRSRKNFIFCYLNLKEYETAKSHLDSLKEQIKLYGEEFTYKIQGKWYLDASMEIHYYLGDLEKSLKYSDSVINYRFDVVDDEDLSNVFLFKGLSWIGLKEKEKGLSYLLKADSLFKIDTTVFNIINDRILYKNLNNYYSGPDKFEKKIEFLNRLIFFDSVQKHNYIFFEPKYIRELETPRLIEEKQQLINSLEQKSQRNRTLLLGGGGLLVVSLGFLGYYYRRQRLFEKRFDALVNTVVLPKVTQKLKEDKAALGISAEIVTQIIEGLEKFERKKKFVNPKVTLNSLAKDMKTNSNYLSRVINLKIGKGFSQYISDLRLEYAINEVLSQALYRKFTIKAIAQECGFKNAESFSRGFYKKYGIYPSYY
ncbi:MAG: helix-turn-helix domain-containing protein, partial [Flavobacteriaceae bacterium]|nr:helix-turn-helix domain-containing protein [Flavobacteriaceae bacterium]